ncbi:sodium-dependent transporter [Bermanella marisrubri]|uniref:Transporter n=1 Tax=Bermanella marisrubri TaxID=207949 RepID=Q1N396_9GAMM|nr:sodium-dependent transporter [Bermanella marisrubri]EAT12695.1 sodium-dependent transporter family protein [Oceanobacter sp. RED65] [Bermanella marisrubri]QIZ85184.1 sodium-dependent transporter [Bermanella marisrubri]
MAEQKSIHGLWRSRWLFILAATGSAVGLGNIWKFPYITGENGGGAFVLVYLACIAIIGIPVMIAEVSLGRMGRQSPINTMQAISKDQKANPFWGSIGWMGALSGFFILSFYSVIAGWALAYVFRMAGGAFDGATPAQAGEIFSGLISNPEVLLAWHTIFMVITIAIVARGVNKGLERAISIMMPLLFLILVVLLGYSMNTDGFAEGFSFLFSFDFSKITGESLMVALGHAFFTLSLGMGAIMAYGAYMPANTSVGKTVLTVAALDTIIALVAGLVIFPVVFSNGMEAAAGPGLLFQTLPVAFSQIPAGTFFGTLFFILVGFAALSSAISLGEPVVAWAVEAKGVSRATAATWLGIIIWLLGIGTVLSFNLWSEYTLFGKTFFDTLDFLTANIMLPLGGLLIAVFVGWKMRSQDVAAEVRMQNPVVYNVWKLILQFIAPLAIAAVLINGLI